MKTRGIAIAALLLAGGSIARPVAFAGPPAPATFSIVAADPAAGEVGVAVASRFFAVGTVVPWAEAKVGAVATQAYANTSWAPKALEMLRGGRSPEEILAALKAGDPEFGRRQFGLVASDGRSITWTGPGCAAWAGGRSGKNYAVQGNILAGAQVVEVMEKKFLEAKGCLADRLFATLRAGDAAGGDSRGKESAALIVYREKGGYGGFNDRAIDVRVDDAEDPFPELGRLVMLGRTSDLWNQAWSAFTEKRYAEALPLQEKAVELIDQLTSIRAEVMYDLAVIRLAAGKKPQAIEALGQALKWNPKLKAQAAGDSDLAGMKDDPAYQALVR